MRGVIFILLLAVFSGCATQKRCLKKFPPETKVEVRDSIVVKDTVIFRDRTFYDTIVGDTIIERRDVPVELRLRPVVAENDYAIATARLANRQLSLELIQKEQVIERIIEDAEKEVRHWKEMYHSKEVTNTIQVKFIPKFYKWCLGILIALLLLIFGYIYIKVRT